MELEINFVENGTIELVGYRDGDIIDRLDFSFKSNLDTQLLTAVDKFLKKNRIDLLSFDPISVTGDVDKNSTAYTIVMTWIAAVGMIKKQA